MNIFVATSTYTKPLDTIDTKRSEHLEWVDRQYRSGRILVSGRRSPAVGGVIVARARSEAEFASVLEGDPFVRYDFARYDVVQFEPTAAALGSPAFAAFTESALAQDVITS